MFNAQSAENIDLGPISMGVPLFLQLDVLGDDRLAKYKSKATAGRTQTMDSLSSG